MNKVKSKRKSIGQLYKVRRNGQERIFGTAIGGYSAIFEWILVRMFPGLHYTGGYAVVMVSGCVLIWWAFSAIIAIILLALYVPLAVYSLLLEYPATAVRQDWGKFNEKKHHDSWDW